MSHTRQGFPAGPETSRRGPERVGHRLVRIYLFTYARGDERGSSRGVSPRGLAVCLGLTRQQSLDCPDAARPLLSRTPRGLTIPTLSVASGWAVASRADEHEVSQVVCVVRVLCAELAARCNLDGEIRSPARCNLVDETHSCSCSVRSRHTI